MNISSAIIYARPEMTPSVKAKLREVLGVQVHASTSDGRLIVSLESSTDRDAADTYQAIERFDGVLSVALVYQQTETLSEQEPTPCTSAAEN